ncbi:carboxymuconolactone decarboxylase family protein [Pseudogemmobacter bohemicus]|uniref:hypothetical protein n=1 Tax=Pseudogemmobacter bohemicus TaxID=2250708 RepID=UPI000DD31BB3|nr:hypothetical protein [Pseudogemmobacter bohemicus]
MADPLPTGPDPESDPRPDRFTSRRHEWRPWSLPLAAIAAPVADADPVPFLPALLAGETVPALAVAVASLARRRGAGLAQGERDLVATAVSRRIGCFFTAAAHARRAATGLRRKREVEVLLEEGLPSPLTGRHGGEIAAASALAAVPARTSRQVFWALEEEKLDDQEITDLILVAGFAAWNARLALAAGQSRPSPLSGQGGVAP